MGVFSRAALQLVALLLLASGAAFGWGPIGADPERRFWDPKRVVIGPSGGVFVGAQHAEQYGRPVIVRLDGATGEEIWRSVSPDGGWGWLWDIALDPAGDLVASGRFYPLNEPVMDFLVFKISGSDGGELWHYRFEPERPEFDWNSGVAVTTDASGDVVATGFAGPWAAMRSLVIVKLSGQTGEELWRYTSDAAVCSGFFGSRGDDVAVDADGNVLVAGMTCLLAPNYQDFTVLKLSGSDGTELWRRSIDGTGTPDHPRDGVSGAMDWAKALALDANGNVTVTGTMRNAGSDYDLLTIKLSGSEGSELWRRVLNGSGNNRDSGQDVALDGGGDVIVSGGLAESPDDEYEDFAVVKLSGVDGSILWRRVLAGDLAQPGSGALELARRVTVDASGDVVATGEIEFAESESDFAVVKLVGADGRVLWSRMVSGAGSGADIGQDVTIDPQGDVIAVGPVSGICTGAIAVALKMSGADGSGTRYVDACPIEGTRVLLRDMTKRPSARKVLLRARDPDDSHWRWIPRNLSAVRPDVHGGTLGIYNPLTGESEAIDLPAQNWEWHERRTQWRYRDRDRSEGPCMKVVLGLDGRRRRALQAVCRGDQIGFSLDEGSQGRMGVQLMLGSRIRARYCVEFGGITLRDRPAALGRSGLFKAMNAPAPDWCEGPDDFSEPRPVTY